MKNYLQSTKNSYKNKAYFLQVVFHKKKKRKQSLSHVTRNSYKYYLLLTQETIFSFAHSAFLTIKSFITSLPFIFFSLLTPSLSPPMAFSLPTDISLYLPLFSFFSLFLLPSITLFLNKVFFFFYLLLLTDPSTVYITIFCIYQTICIGLVCR